MSVRFDAATDQITRASPPSVSAGITLACWAYVSVDQNDFATIARIHNGGSTIATWATSTDGLGGPNYFTGGGSVTNATNFAVSAWRKVAITCTGTSAKSYVQNPGGSTEVDSGTVSSAGTPTELCIGGRGGGDSSEWWNGRIAYFRVWTTELSQAEIEAEWNSITPVRTSNLWADWPLVAHTDLTDHSGNGRNLTAGATATTTEADPPVATSTNASAGSAAIGLAAQSATIKVAPNVGSAAFTFAGQSATTKVAPTAGSATFALAGQSATTQVAPTSGSAAVALAGQSATTTVAPNAGAASVSATARDATVLTGAVASADVAAVGFAAQTVGRIDVSPSVGVATFALAGQDATPSTSGGTSAPAGVAALGLAGWSPSTTVAPSVGTALIDIDAWVASASGTASASAGSAAFTFAAVTPSRSIKVSASSASIGLSARDVASSGQSIACADFVTLVTVDQHFGSVVLDAHSGTVVLDEHSATAGICGRS